MTLFRTAKGAKNAKNESKVQGANCRDEKIDRISKTKKSARVTCIIYQPFLACPPESFVLPSFG